MKKISLQTKIVLLAFFLVIIPIIIANLIFSSHKVIFQTRGVITGAKGICGQMKNIGETPSREEIAEMPLESFQIRPEELAEQEGGEEEEKEEKEESGNEEEGEEGDEEESKPAKKGAKGSDADVEIVEKSEDEEGEEGEDDEEAKAQANSSKNKPHLLSEEELINAIIQQILYYHRVLSSFLLHEPVSFDARQVQNDELLRDSQSQRPLYSNT